MSGPSNIKRDFLSLFVVGLVVISLILSLEFFGVLRPDREVAVSDMLDVRSPVSPSRDRSIVGGGAASSGSRSLIPAGDDPVSVASGSDAPALEWRGIESAHIDTGAVTSRTIEDGTIRGRDIDHDTNIEVEAITAREISFETISSGSWSASMITPAYGGTGLDGSSAAHGTLLIGTGSGYALATLTEGSGIAVASGAGSITLSSTLGTGIDGAEIADGTIEEADFEATNAPTAGYILSYDSGTGGFTWISNSGGSGSSKFTDAGTYTYLTETADDLLIGGSTADLGFFFDVSASTLAFEGATGNTFETLLAVTDPTADRTITLPNVTGTVVTTGNLTDITGLGAAAITADALDFTELQDQLDLDASTDILADGAEVFSITNAGTGNSFLVRDASGDTTPFVIDAAGNVGIGTATPTANLDVNAVSTSSASAETYATKTTVFDTGATAGIDVNYGDYTEIIRTGATGGTVLNFGKYINVIGDTAGSSTNYGVFVDVSGADVNYPAIFDGGNVGIGDATPEGRLDVELSSTSTTANTLYGSNVAVSDTGVVTTGTDTTYGSYTSLTRTGATGGTIVGYGDYVTATMGTAIGSLYGSYVSATGGFNSYGQSIAVNGTGSFLTTGIALSVAAPSSNAIAFGIQSNLSAASWASNYGASLNVTDSSTAPNTTYGIYGAASDTGVVTTGTDTTYGSYTSLTRTGATGGTLNNYGGYITVTGDTGGTSTNTGLFVSVSGADTNYAGIFQGGNVGIGDTTPAALLTVGSGDLFQVNASGAIAAATGITSSGSITFSGLSGGGVVQAASGTGLLSAGTLGVTSGGTGTATAFTQGSVVFAGASGVYAQDNANFFWDDTDNALEIGGVASARKFSIIDTVSSAGNYDVAKIAITDSVAPAGLSYITGLNLSVLDTGIAGSGTIKYIYGNSISVGDSASTGIGTKNYVGSYIATSTDGSTQTANNTGLYIDADSGSTVRGIDVGNSQSGATGTWRGINVRTMAGTTLSATGVYIAGQAAGSVTSYGLYLASQGTGVGNWALYTAGSSDKSYIGGALGIGQNMPTTGSKLTISKSSTSTTADTIYGSDTTVSDTGIVTTGTDTTYGNYASLTRTGATGGTLNNYGGYATLTGTFASGAGTINNYGQYATVSGDPTGTSTNYGSYAAVTGADTNYGFYALLTPTGGTTSSGFAVSLTDATTSANTLQGSSIAITDTGIVTTGTDIIRGNYINIGRTGATGGSLTVTGQEIGISTDAAGSGTLTSTGSSVFVFGGDTVRGLNVTTYGIPGTTAVYGADIIASGFTGGAGITTYGVRVQASSSFTGGSGAVYGFHSTVYASSGDTAYALYADAGTGGGTEYAGIFMNGSVGIGDTTPDGSFDVDLTSAASTADSIYGSNITVTDTGAVAGGTDMTYGSYASVARTGATGGTANSYGLYGAATADNAGSGTSSAIGVYGYAGGNGSSVDSGVGVQAYLTGAVGISTGYVFRASAAVSGLGIDTAYGLHVGALSNAITANYGIYVASQSGGSSPLSYALYSAGGQSYHAGNFGIGDTAPDQLLEVLSSGAAATQVSIGNTNAGDYDAQIGFEMADGTNTWTMGVDDSASDAFKISTTALGTNDRFVIDSTGAVGIGVYPFSGGIFDITGRTLSAESSGAAGIGWFTYSVTKNDSLVKTFPGIRIVSDINTGASNANTTLNILAIDTSNTATTGVTTNLIKASYGGVQQFLIDSSGNVTAAGQLNGADGLVTKVSAGACSDATFTADTDGNLCIDSTNGRIYYRYGGAWHYSAQTAGFQVPDYEAYSYDFSSGSFDEDRPLVAGDFLMPFVETSMEDGALHGLYARWSDVKDELFAEERSQLATLDLKTDRSITTLGALQASVDTQLSVVGDALAVLGAENETTRASLTTLDSRVLSTETATTALQSQVAGHDATLALLETQMATLTDQNAALMEFFTALDLESVVTKDPDGDVDLLGGTLKARVLSTGGIVIENIDESAPTIGTATLYPVATDADADGTDDWTGLPMTDPAVAGRDGRSVIIETSAVSVSSRIFVTPREATDKPLAVTDRSGGEHFTVELKEVTDEAIPFDWWVVGESDR